MSRILFAWELGANYGHLTADLPIAKRLRDDGHDVVFAVRDLKIATEILVPAQFPFVAAPVSTIASNVLPINFAEILLVSGLNDEGIFHGLMDCWIDLFNHVGPDVIVIDHAPMALIAAHTQGLSIVQFGSGFTVPPTIKPFPTIRPWETIGVARLQQVDHRAVSKINAFFRSRGISEASHVSDLFGRYPALLNTFPELDHYGDRDDATYIGSFSESPSATTTNWSTKSRTRIFAYLRPSVPGIETVLLDLEESDAEVICVMPGATVELQKYFKSTTVRLLPDPVHLRSLLNRADLVVTYGGAGMIVNSLLAGVPMLLVPQTVEQYLGAIRVDTLGAGIVVGIDQSRERFANKIEQLLHDHVYKQAAQSFAAKHAYATTSEATSRAVDVILQEISRVT